MAAINESLFQLVLKEMLKFKPSLQKMLVADDEEEETLDPRLLGDIIIKNFPWLVGIELRRLFSASMRQPDRMRLDQIFKTIERTMQFISFVMICQIWKDIFLMKSLKNMDEYLNLSPLIIDTNSEVIDNKEKFDIKKDIFMYTKFRGDHLMYIGTEVTEKCDLRSLHNYQILLTQFKDMILTISGNPVIN